MSVDGGKVRLRGKPKEGCYWRDYKAVRLQGIYYGAFFDSNQSLIDYVNSQPLSNPLVCLGDGHEGVWNLVREFAIAKTATYRQLLTQRCRITRAANSQRSIIATLGDAARTPQLASGVYHKKLLQEFSYPEEQN